MSPVVRRGTEKTRKEQPKASKGTSTSSFMCVSTTRRGQTACLPGKQDTAGALQAGPELWSHVHRSPTGALDRPHKCALPQFPHLSSGHKSCPYFRGQI